MLVCTVYILIGMAFTTTIIELVRYEMNMNYLISCHICPPGGSMQRAGVPCRS